MVLLVVLMGRGKSDFGAKLTLGVEHRFSFFIFPL